MSKIVLSSPGAKLTSFIMLRLHYVPGDHGNHVFGHRGGNGMNVRQCRGTGQPNVTQRGCCGCRAKILNCRKICHGSHGGNEKRDRSF
ncbi:hypothetical protein DPMN_046762 [Dreissena polymorpha]|uniref:Uncharacterized protein n=1 Tax=Dreissena polymorpha TaxID=45954 RepID=A0A9D4D8H0_DREPO|nr:hypothetical protein DPMN_046762 [Dreissena polymorpha]